MSKTVFHALIACSFATLATAGANPTLILDDFDADPNDDAGGPRDISLLVDTAGPFGGGARFDLVTTSMFEGDIGAAVFVSDPGVTARGVITWNNGGNGLALDAAALGIVGFEFDFAAVDQEFPMRIELRDGSGGTGSAEIRIDPILLSDGIQTASLALASINSFGGLDLTDLSEIQLVFNFRSDRAEGLDFVFTQFRAVVPTPGTAAMLAMGGLLASRRRR
jgi:hypothetical protein